MSKIPRLAVRAIILIDNRLLLVNAFREKPDALWCLPGGGVESGASLPDNLKREIREECGLGVSVGPPALVNEFHDPETGFHQVEVVFRCAVLAGTFNPNWQDTEQIVSVQRLFQQRELADIPLLPKAMETLPWSMDSLTYDPLEVMKKAPLG